MQCITLLTDFGGKDSYVGVMKGVIQGINPQARVIDLCHEVPPQDIHSAAFLLKVSYKYFPRGTIHVIVVDPGVGSKRKIVCLKTSDYLFLAPDNGVLTPIRQEEKIEEIVEVSRQRYFLKEVSRTFQGRDIFAPVAAHLSLGVNPSELGPKVSHFRDLKIPPVHFSEKGLEGEIIYIDRFGNLITNITRADLRGLEKKISGKGIRITVGGKEIRKINKSYAESQSGELLAIIGSSHYLEISLNQGNARKVLGLDRGEKLIIVFE
ncbi:MAG: SAM-dependent chlorinase/fluorinase [Nitrospirae bacterium]|nr:SAM-dependent chlorinase/fluorinase [Nitrospirota bacterium]